MSTNGTAIHADQNYSQSTIVKVTDVNALRMHWPWVEERLKIVKHRDVSAEGWQPAHVREAILRGFTGQSTVELFFLIAMDNSIEGFVVTTVYADPYTQLPESLVIWIGWGNSQLIEHHLPFFTKLASDRFLNRLEFVSGRRGWLNPKKAAAHGFAVRARFYTKRI
jgi:hypothetical protein